MGKTINFLCTVTVGKVYTAIFSFVWRKLSISRFQIVPNESPCNFTFYMGGIKEFENPYVKITAAIFTSQKIM